MLGLELVLTIAVSDTGSRDSKVNVYPTVTRQFSDKPTHSQANRELANSWTSQLDKLFYENLE